MYGRFECVIFGDFNLLYIDWATKTAVAPGKRLVDFSAQHNLVQRVLELTMEDHVLDLVLCTEAGLIRGNVEVCDKLGSSDHRMVSFEILAGSKNIQRIIMTPDFRRADFRLLRELASHTNPTFPENAGANVCFNNFEEWLETLCDRCIPKRRVRRGHQSTKPLWWSPEVGRVIKERQAAYRRSKRHRTEVNVMAHVNACRAVEYILRNSQSQQRRAGYSGCQTKPKGILLLY